MHTGGSFWIVLVLFCLLQLSETVSIVVRRSGFASKNNSPLDKDQNFRSLPTYSRAMRNRGGMTIPAGTTSGSTGVNNAHVAADDRTSVRAIILRNMLGLWGVIQVVSILANALKRLYPIAAQPFIQQDMEPYQWALYVVWSIYMAYAEGYKAFQLKFSPMVVQRAFAIYEQPNVLNCILAGPYSMGLFGASRKRMIVSWCITAGVFSLVKVVKMLPYPYRSIVDAGVVVGLSWGTLSIIIYAIKALLGGRVDVPGEVDESKTADSDIPSPDIKID
jgi:hypothetical protein